MTKHRVLIYKVIGSLPGGKQYRKIPLRFDPCKYTVGDLKSVFEKFDKICTVFPHEALFENIKENAKLKVKILLPLSLFNSGLMLSYSDSDGWLDVNGLIKSIKGVKGFLDHTYIDIIPLPSIGTYRDKIFRVDPSIITIYLYAVLLDDFHEGYTHFIFDISTGLNVYNSLAELTYRDAIIYMKLWKGFWGNKRASLNTYILFIEPVMSREGVGECSDESKEIFLEHIDPQPLILWPPKLDREFKDYSNKSMELKIFENENSSPNNMKELVNLIIHTKYVFRALEVNAPLILFKDAILLKDENKSAVLDYRDEYMNESYYVDKHIKVLTEYIIEEVLSSFKVSSKSGVVEVSAEGLGRANYTLVRALTYGIAISKLLHVNYEIPFKEPYIEGYTLSSSIHDNNWHGSFKKVLNIYKDLGMDSNSTLLKRDLMNVGDLVLKKAKYNRPSYYRNLIELRDKGQSAPLKYDYESERRNFLAHSGMLDYITLVKGTFKRNKIYKLNIWYGKVERGNIKTDEEKLREKLKNLLLGKYRFIP